MLNVGVAGIHTDLGFNVKVVASTHTCRFQQIESFNVTDFYAETCALSRSAVALFQRRNAPLIRTLAVAVAIAPPLFRRSSAN